MKNFRLLSRAASSPVSLAGLKQPLGDAQAGNPAASRARREWLQILPPGPFPRRTAYLPVFKERLAVPLLTVSARRRFAEQGPLSFSLVGQFLPIPEGRGFPAEEGGRLFR
jgi:hypothetical protein